MAHHTVQTFAEPSVREAEPAEEELQILKEFDLVQEYGPCVGVYFLQNSA